MIIKKFVADSYFEALLKARAELGEDVFVVTSRTFKDTKWGGIYSKEMVEITAMAPKPRTTTADKSILSAPMRPVPTEEVQINTQAPIVSAQNISLKTQPIPSPQPTTSSVNSSSSYQNLNSIRVSKPLQSSQKAFTEEITTRPYTDKATPYTQPTHTRFHLHNCATRNIHTIRSIQMGDTDPQPQTVSMNDTFETVHEERVVKLLEAILNSRNKRDNEGNTKQTSAMLPPELSKSPSFQHFTKKLEEIIDLLNEMQKTTSQALQASSNLPMGMQYLRERLEANEMPHHVLEDLFVCLTRDLPITVQRDPKLVQEEFTRFLSRKIKFLNPTNNSSNSRPQISILIGPTGVGKTTTIAKLAATYALDVVEAKSVAMITTDTFRIGATAQLSQFAQILEAALEIAFSPDDIPDMLNRYKDKDVILVDTAGRCQKQEQELKELKKFVDRFPAPTKYLVLSATTKYSDMLENVTRFGKVGFDHLIFTKVDETNSVGPLLALLLETSANLAYITNGQMVPDDFRCADLDFFLQRLFP